MWIPESILALAQARIVSRTLIIVTTHRLLAQSKWGISETAKLMVISSLSTGGIFEDPHAQVAKAGYTLLT